jgi:hypothetical protein
VNIGGGGCIGSVIAARWQKRGLLRHGGIERIQFAHTASRSSSIVRV